MNKNLLAYNKLDKDNLINQYVVIIEGKTVAKGIDIERMLKVARRRYPHKIPFVAKIPEQRLLVLISIINQR